MSDHQRLKLNIVEQLKNLCAHCASGNEHYCPVQEIAERVEHLQGVPLMINSKFKGLLWSK